MTDKCSQGTIFLLLLLLTCALGGEGEDSPGLAGPEYVLPGDLHLGEQKQENLESVSGFKL